MINKTICKITKFHGGSGHPAHTGKAFAEIVAAGYVLNCDLESVMSFTDARERIENDPKRGKVIELSAEEYKKLIEIAAADLLKAAGKLEKFGFVYDNKVVGVSECAAGIANQV